MIHLCPISCSTKNKEVPLIHFERFRFRSPVDNVDAFPNWDAIHRDKAVGAGFSTLEGGLDIDENEEDEEPAEARVNQAR